MFRKMVLVVWGQMEENIKQNKFVRKEKNTIK